METTDRLRSRSAGSGIAPRSAGSGVAPRAAESRHTLAWLAWIAAAAAVPLLVRNPLYLAVELIVIVAVHLAAHADAPWARAFSLFLRLGLLVLVLRTALAALAGDGRAPVVFTLPAVRLPRILGGIGLGGPISGAAVAAGFRDGLVVLVLIAAFGAFNACVNPSKLLRRAPAFLYEAGLVVTVALAFVPQTVTGLGRVQEAQRVRGFELRRLRDVGPLLLAVLSGGLERTLTLAEAMESRGYGRRANARLGARPKGLLAAAGAAALALGLAAELGLQPAAGRWIGPALLATAVICLTAATAAAGRGNGRTRYRHERWRSPDSVVAVGAAICLLVVIVARAKGVGDLGWAAVGDLAMPGFSWPVGAALLGLGAPVVTT